jgi:hypothetical protein
MEAKELFHHDGKPTGIFHCAKCRVVYRDKEGADKCCLPAICKCGTEIEDKYYLICRACRDKQQAIKELERLNKAEVVQDHEGWIYSDGYGSRDGYFEDIYDLIEYLEDNEIPENQWPEWVYVCTEELPCRLDVDDVCQTWIDNGYEDIDDSIQGKKELQEALNKFWEQNKQLVSYTPDYSKKIAVPKKQEVPA